MPLLLGGLLPGLRAWYLAAAFLLPFCCCLGMLLLGVKPPEAYRTLRIPCLVAFPAVQAPGYGGLVGLVSGNALLRLVGRVADHAPDGVHTSCLELVVAQGFVAPHRFLVGAQ